MVGEIASRWGKDDLSTARKFTSDVVVRVGFQILNGLKGLAFLPLISRQFGAEAFAIWSQIYITVTLLTPIINLRLNDALVRYLGSSEDRARMLAATATLTMGVSGLVVVVGWLLRHLLAAVVFADKALSDFAVLLVGMLLVRANMQWVLAYFRSLSAIRTHTAIQVVQIVGELLVLTVVPVLLGQRLELAIAVIIGVDLSILTGAILVIARREGFSLSPDWSALKRLLQYSFPLIATAVLYWIVNSFDRFVIVHYRGLEDVAVYSGAYRVSQVLKTLVQPLSFVLLPLISRLWERNKIDTALLWMSRSLEVYLVAATPAAIGLIILGPALSRLLGGGGLAAPLQLFAWLVSGVFIVGIYQIHVYLVYLHGKTSRLITVFGITGSFNVVMNLFLVPRMGIMGAAITTFFSYALQFVVLLIVIRRYPSIPVNRSRLIRVVASSLFMGGVVYLVMRLTSAGIVSLVALGVAVYLGALFLSRGISRGDIEELLSTLRKGKGV